MSNNQNTERPPQSDLLQVDLQRLLLKLLSYWWLFALTLSLTVGFGYFYLRYATYNYAARAVLLIKDTGRSGVLSEESILLDKGLTGGGKSLVNEIEILRSTPLMAKVVEQLDLDISFYRQGKFKETEFYKTAPLIINRLDSIERFASFFIEMSDPKSFLLKADLEDEGIRHYYDVPFESRYGFLEIKTISAERIIPGTFRVVIRPIESIAASYASRLFIERIGDIRTSSVLQLNLNDPVPEKARDILSSLIQNYNLEEIKDENKVLKNTLEFIDNRVKMLTKELNVIEGDIERFKSDNAIITESAAASLNFTLSEIRSAVKEINQFEVQKSMLSSIETLLLSTSKDFELLPVNLSGENTSLTGLLQQYNSLVLERNRLAKTASTENPVMEQLDQRLQSTQTLLLETIQNIKKDLDIPIQQLEKNITDLNASMEGVPTIEKNLLERTRMQKVKEELFLYLLQKREETALSEAVATASTRIIEPAKSSGGPVSPKKRLVYLGCILLGLVVPVSLIGLRAIFDNRISSEDSVKQLTNIPIVGRIIQSKKKAGSVVVKHGNRSPINEMFRQLRTNLSYMALNEKHKTIATTSFISGEGKSFISINLAMTLALSKKKVVLIELDLRKPKMARYLGLTTNNKGVTSYLIGESTLEEITESYPTQENLHIIKSGPIPPNPYELINSTQMSDLLEQLKNQYDYVIIDTPPIGLVSDSLLLRNQINNLLIVVRHRYTKKFMVREVQKLHQNGELPNASIVLNGIKYSRLSYGYGYGYGGYRSTYGKGYYD